MCLGGESGKTGGGNDARHTVLGDADGEWPEERVEDDEGFRDDDAMVGKRYINHALGRTG